MNKKMYDISSNINSRRAVSVGVEPKFWVDIDGVDYIYKFYYPKKVQNLVFAEMRTFNEVLVSRLCKKLGIDCIDVEFAKANINKGNDGDVSTKGCLIKSYLDDCVESISMEEISTYYNRHKDIMLELNDPFFAYRAIKFFCDREGFALDDGVLENLKQIAVFDFVTGQSDRNFNNIELLSYEKDGKQHIKLAPMFDNGRCFDAFHFGLGKDVPCRAFNYFFINTTFCSPNTESLFSIANGMAYAIKTDKTVQDLYKKILQVDIKTEIKNLIMESGFNIGSEAANYIECYWNKSLELTKDSLNKLKDEKLFDSIYDMVEKRFRQNYALDLGLSNIDKHEVYLNFRCYKQKFGEANFEDFEKEYQDFVQKIEDWKNLKSDKVPTILDYKFIKHQFPNSEKETMGKVIAGERIHREIGIAKYKFEYVRDNFPELFEKNVKNDKVWEMFDKLKKSWIDYGDDCMIKPTIEDAIAICRKNTQDTDGGRL